MDIASVIILNMDIASVIIFLGYAPGILYRFSTRAMTLYMGEMLRPLRYWEACGELVNV